MAMFFVLHTPSVSFAQTTPDPKLMQCIGGALAKYFIEVQTGVKAKNLKNIYTLSPAFNMTSPYEKDIYSAMRIIADEYFKPLNYPNFYGFAGNTYTVDNRRALFYLQNYNWNGDTVGAHAGTNLVITEYGDFDTKHLNDLPTYPRVGIGQSSPGDIRSTMNEDLSQLSSLNGVSGVLFFNSLDPSHGYTNPEFKVHNLSDGFYQSVTNGNTEAGINSGMTTSGETFPNLIKNAGLTAGWSLELVTGINDLDGATRYVMAAHAANIKPILRLCYGDSCGFSDPQVLLSFLEQLNSKVDGPVWVIAGPNEPMSEHWAAPECAPSTPPFTLDFIPCSDTTNPEFHSLRPYPASPCKPKTLVENGQYLCGQDLVVKDVYEFTDGGGDCQTVTDASGATIHHCKYSVTGSTSNVSLGIKDAYFPIMGNTEKVPNSTNANLSYEQRNTINFLQRVNNYVSWYLNGITFRAEEQPEDLLLNPFPGNPTTLSRIINLSGPLKKLLPQRIQTVERLDEKDKIGSERHNQTVTCNNTSDPQQCYSVSNNPVRITDATGTTTNKAFQYVPFSSTEDLVGESSSYLNYPAPSCNSTPLDTDSGITCIDLKLDNAARDLYFAHIEESNQLGGILQKTFKPTGVVPSPAPVDQLNELIKTPYCELIDSRTNPGDKLYGELVRPNDTTTQPMSGRVSYNANFTCDFRVPTQTEINQCKADTCTTLTGDAYNQCITDCQSTNDTCQREIYIPVSVQIKPPSLDETWNTFVAGGMSIAKRIFPQLGAGTPYTELKDIPGNSPAFYTSTHTAGSINPLQEVTLAGNPSANRPGSTAQIYFPHIGSVYDYFLKGIQKALRPKGIDEIAAVPVIPAPSCVITGANFRSQALLSIIAQAAQWAHVPAQLLSTVVEKEGCGSFGSQSGLCALGDAEVLQYSSPGAQYPRNCRTGISSASGPMQIINGIFNQWSNAVNLATSENRVPNNCNIKDSIFAAAWILSANYAPTLCPQVGYNVGSTPTTWTLADMERSITKWVNGCMDSGQAACTTRKSLLPAAACFTETYCAQLVKYNSSITTTCNSAGTGGGVTVPGC